MTDNNETDNYGFYANGINEFTKTEYDWYGFNREGIHKNGTKLDDDGYDRDGYHQGFFL